MAKRVRKTNNGNFWRGQKRHAEKARRLRRARIRGMAASAGPGNFVKAKKQRFERKGVARVVGGPFAVTIAIDEGRLEQLKQTPEVLAGIMQQVANHWHTQILPRHFQRTAKEKYGYAPRTSRYEERKRGRPDLYWTGSMQRDLQTNAQLMDTGKAIRLKMHARVLNFVPNMQESDVNLYVKHDKELKGSKVRKTYPNMKRELRILLPDEHEELSKVAQAALAEVFGAAPN